MQLTEEAAHAADTLPPAFRPAPLPLAAEVPAHAEPPLTVIEGRAYWTWGDAKEVWRYRELFYYLMLRDIKLRYKQTIFGVGWSVFQPLATVLVFVVFLGLGGKLGAGVDNYVLFVLCGVLPWTYFNNATANAANSLIGNERLVTKTFFPRVLLPASNVGAATFDFGIALVILATWLAVDGPATTWRVVLAPLLIALLAATAFGFGTLLSALIATQRDFRYLLTFGLQLWMFATPCIYLPQDAFGPQAQRWLQLNPLYGIILNFRNCLTGEPLQWPALAVSASSGLLILAVGLIYFRRVENTMADTL